MGHLARQYMVALLGTRARADLPGMRTAVESDQAELARLMHCAYLGSVDDEGESQADALVEVHKTFAGEYGAFDASCSKVVARGDELVHATLLTRWEDRPFVAFTMTAPTAKRSGLARGCLVNAMQDLHARGEHELGLVVTVANLPARVLYESLGFVRQE